jgi:peptide chain release factor 2
LIPFATVWCFCGGIFDWDTAEQRLSELNNQSEDPKLWNDPAAAQKVMRARTTLESQITGYKGLERDLDDAITLIDLGDEMDDAASVSEGEALLRKLQATAQKREVEALLSGEADGFDTYLEVHAGAGGTEAQDWAEMVLRMYTRFAEQRGYKVTTTEYSAGDGAGIKSATLEIKGENAYGWLKTESGVHRLVRISPYDANAKRHTSFTSVWVYPIIDSNIKIEIAESDCRIDTYRASGAGGQHVNTTDSAVRITHIPTNIAVSCQQERSQHKNRATAWDMLRAKLYEKELKEREARANAEAASKTDAGWGHSLRSYVLQPYQLVKDVRTGHQSTDPDAVLDGDLEPFLEAALAHRIKGGGNSNFEDLE